MQKLFDSPIAASIAARRRGRWCANIPLLLLSLVLASIGTQVRAGTLPNAASGPASAWALAQSNPLELMRKTTHNELANSYGYRFPWRCQMRKVSAKSDTTKEIVETASGGVARLIAVGGRPLSALQEQQELERLRALLADPAVEAHRRRNDLKDAENIKEFTRLLPDAFVYQYAGPVQTESGAMIRLTYAPNPKFTPPDFETHILTGIRGEVWIDPHDLRITRIQGHTFKTVDIGWGIIGTLYPGATAQIDQSKTGACGWQLTHFSLHLDGKELLFKKLHIAVTETLSDYQPVPEEWNYRDAVRWLLRIPATPSNQTRKL